MFENKMENVFPFNMTDLSYCQAEINENQKMYTLAVIKMSDYN